MILITISKQILAFKTIFVWMTLPFVDCQLYCLLFWLLLSTAGRAFGRDKYGNGDTDSKWFDWLKDSLVQNQFEVWSLFCYSL